MKEKFITIDGIKYYYTIMYLLTGGYYGEELIAHTVFFTETERKPKFKWFWEKERKYKELPIVLFKVRGDIETTQLSKEKATEVILSAYEQQVKRVKEIKNNELIINT